MIIEDFFKEAKLLPAQAQGIRNFTTLTGAISSTPVFSYKFLGEVFYTFVLETRRLSDDSDLLLITFSERIFDKSSVVIGQPVEVVGQIQSYNRVRENKSKLLITVFSQEINLLSELSGTDKNEVTLAGYVCRKPVFRVTPFGREITDIILATNRANRKSDYLPVLFWGQNARYGETLNVGEKIRVKGRIQSRIYKKRDEYGNVTERTAFEISASSLKKLST